MATANIDLPSGAKVQIEGTAEDINKILAACGAVNATGEPVPLTTKAKRNRANNDANTPRRATSGVMQQIRELIDDAFFGQKRSISDVQRKLEETGHIYPLTHLSTPLRRLVRNKELRRMRDGRNWAYVNA